MRYLAIDLGDRRTGLALGDSITRIATPFALIEVPLARGRGGALLDALADVVAEELGPPGSSGELVFGLPLNMDGTEGPRARLVRDFAARLSERTGHAARMHDERLTSVQADADMARSGLTRRQKKVRRDAIAAAAILRSFLAENVE